jgi:outer membrane protein TolC
LKSISSIGFYSKKRVSIGLFAIVLIVVVLTIVRDRARSSTIPLQQPSTIPEHVSYKFLFDRVTYLTKRANEAEQKGKSGASLRSIIKREAALSDEHATVLEQTAADCEQELAQLDAKAKVIIDSYKAQYIGGRVPPGEKLQPPPQELIALQEERKAAILRAKDRLHIALGDQEFARFESFIKLYITPKVKPASNSLTGGVIKLNR